MATLSEPLDIPQEVKLWLEEIATAKTREKEFLKKGQDILEIYAADREDSSGTNTKSAPFNILYSNTETLSPALYSNLPRPLVSRRFKDDDPIGMAASKAAERMLSFLLDTNIEGYEEFGEGMEAAVFDALLPGRAFTTVKYSADIEGDDKYESGKEEDSEDGSRGYVAFQLVCLESKAWNKVTFGFAKKWTQVPWIAFEEEIDREEAVKKFGQNIAKQLKYTAGTDSKDTEHRDDDDKNRGEKKSAKIYQIWDKDGGKKVRYVSAQYPDDYLRVDDDPMGLTGFFPCPKPLQFVNKSHNLRVTALYKLYETQAEELNELTRRIKNITKAIKARGIYDPALGDDLSALFSADDNELVPANMSSSIAMEKGIANSIWYAPIGELMTTLDQLYRAREQCKQVIYEITGISDILRGSTKASETFGAQELKAKYGSLRLSKMQKSVEKYAKSLIRMMLEVSASKFDESAWAQMTGLPYLSSSDFAKVKAIAQAAQQSQQPLPPEIQQALQQPSWAQVLPLLKNDIIRSYKVDIETNSTLQPEAAEDQKHINDLLTAMGQFLNGVGPMVAKGIMPFEVARSMLLTIARRYQFGREIEEDLLKMKAPTPEDNGKEAEMKQGQGQMQAQVQQLQAQMQMVQQKGQMDAQVAKMEFDQKVTQQSAQVQQIQVDAKNREREFSLAEEKMRLDVQAIQLKASTSLATSQQQHNDKTNATTEVVGGMGKAIMEIISKIDEVPGILAQHGQDVIEAQTTLMEATQHTHTMLQEVVRLLGAPKIKTVQRGPDGKIVSVHETVQGLSGEA